MASTSSTKNPIRTTSITRRPQRGLGGILTVRVLSLRESAWSLFYGLRWCWCSYLLPRGFDTFTAASTDKIYTFERLHSELCYQGMRLLRSTPLLSRRFRSFGIASSVDSWSGTACVHGFGFRCLAIFFGWLMVADNAVKLCLCIDGAEVAAPTSPGAT